jgi:suppressor for copper-sensitivity B
MFRSLGLYAYAAVLGLLALGSVGHAQTASPHNQKPDIKADLIVGGVDAKEPQYAWVGVRVALGPGWKTYWKSPGDGGLPPEFDWSQSLNLKGAEVQWPAPRRMNILGVDTIGYTHEVVFPVRLQLKDPERETSVRLKLTVYACSTICVREERDLTATILSGSSDNGSQSVIDGWRARVPRSTSNVLTVTSLERLASEAPQLRINVASTLPFGNLDAFVESDPAVYADKPRIEFGESGSASLTVAFPGQSDAAIRSQALSVTILAGDDSVVAVSPAETSEPATGARSLQSPVAQPAPGEDAPLSLWSLVVTALLGGFILNLMPCVFPVLSLKLLSFVREDDADLAQIRLGFIATAAGVVASFLVLASGLAALKAAGSTIGWGIQFQQPFFLGGMVIVVSLFAANLLGLFNVALPSAVMNGLTAKAQGAPVPSQFATGFVATLLATPCSAPFVGTAVGFALARGASEIYLIFAALGVGMASPYLLVSAFPRLAQMLPRPGRWIGVVKTLMAVALLLTAAWLLFVLSNVAGGPAAMITGAAIALALLLLQPPTSVSRGAWVFRGIAGLGLVVAVLATIVGVPGNADSKEIPWRPFVKEDVQSLVRSGRTVFVDITADWCVVCKVNKAFVIDQPDIARRLSTDIVPSQGNWTRPDANISSFMKEHGRYGLPFNIVFGPGAPEGIVLPELLSKAALEAAFDRALSKSTNLITQPREKQ